MTDVQWLARYLSSNCSAYGVCSFKCRLKVWMIDLFHVKSKLYLFLATFLNFDSTIFTFIG
jgi:hypothetical protein